MPNEKINNCLAILVGSPGVRFKLFHIWLGLQKTMMVEQVKQIGVLFLRKFDKK